MGPKACGKEIFKILRFLPIKILFWPNLFECYLCQSSQKLIIGILKIQFFLKMDI